MLSPFIITVLSDVTYARPSANAVCSSTKLGKALFDIDLWIPQTHVTNPLQEPRVSGREFTKKAARELGRIRSGIKVESA